MTLAPLALLAPGEPVLVGLSGGVDSVVLLHLLKRLGHPVTAAHLDHGLRPESADDARWLAACCEAWGMPLIAGHAGVLAPGENAARDARYAFLAEAARAAGLTAVAVGHHADDQAETVLFRLARGTGPAGLGAMAPTRELAPGLRLVRPLLGCTRAGIEAQARAWALEWREDPTNQDPGFARNRLRRDVLPALAAVNAGAVDHIAALAALQREDVAQKEERARRQAKFMVQAIAQGVVEVDRQALTALPQAEARWLLREAAQGGSFEAAALARALATAGDGTARDLGDGWRATATPTRLVLVGPTQRPAAVPFTGNGAQATRGWGWEVQVEPAASALPAGPTCVRFDARALPGSLEWRCVEPDHDEFRPWGHDRPVRLRAFLTRQGIPHHRQGAMLGLASGSTLAWLVGVRRGGLAPVGKQTTEVVEIQARAGFRV